MVSLSGKTARLRGPCTQTRVCAHGQQLGPKVQALLHDASSSSTSRPCGDRPGTRAHSVPSAPQVRTRRNAHAAPSQAAGRRPHRRLRSLPHARARALLGVPWRLSPPSGARESGQRAGARFPLAELGAEQPLTSGHLALSPLPVAAQVLLPCDGAGAVAGRAGVGAGGRRRSPPTPTLPSEKNEQESKYPRSRAGHLRCHQKRTRPLLRGCPAPAKEEKAKVKCAEWARASVPNAQSPASLSPTPWSLWRQPTGPARPRPCPPPGGARGCRGCTGGEPQRKAWLACV